MNVQVSANVRHNGKPYKPGEVIEDITSLEAKRLVKLGDAFFIGEKGNMVKDLEKNDIQEDILKDFKDTYEYQELKKEAAEIGLEFPGNISFENLVKLIIDNDKVDEFFDDEGDGE